MFTFTTKFYYYGLETHSSSFIYDNCINFKML